MSSPNNIPPRKRRVVFRRQPQITSPRPTKPPFEFSSIKDSPKGVRYGITPTGFYVSASARSIGVALLLFATTCGIGLLMWKGLEEGENSSGFYIFLGVLAAISCFLGMYLVWGREELRKEANILYLRMCLFGIGFSRKLPFDKIEGAAVRKRRFVSRHHEGALLGERTESAMETLEIRTNQGVKKVGVNLRPQQLYYMRYVLIENLRDFHAGKSSLGQF